MIDLQATGIGQHRAEIGGGIIAARGKANQVLVPVAGRDLEKAQPIARGDEPHGLGIDGDRPGTKRIPGQVFFMEIYRSEEHTSELQSLMRISYAVFCLKKKTPYLYITHQP